MTSFFVLGLMKKYGFIFLLCLSSTISAQDELVIHDFTSLSPLLNSQSDTTYVVNFWATWCKPCIEELPYFEQLNQRQSSIPVKVILVSLDFKRQIESKLKPFLATNPLTSEVVVLYERNPNDWIDKVDPEWSGAIPATLAWHRGKRHFSESQFENYTQLEEIINSLEKN